MGVCRLRCRAALARRQCSRCAAHLGPAVAVAANAPPRLAVRAAPRTLHHHHHLPLRLHHHRHHLTLKHHHHAHAARALRNRSTHHYPHLHHHPHAAGRALAPGADGRGAAAARAVRRGGGRPG